MATAAKNVLWQARVARMRRLLAVTGLGYLFVLVFFVGYAAIAAHFTELSSGQTILLALLLAAPIALPFVAEWLSHMRLTGVNIGLTTLAVSFEKAAVAVPPTPSPLENQLANEIGLSDSEAIAEAIRRIAEAEPTAERHLLKINLEPPGKETPYWWSTRLYLLAALLIDYTDVKQLYFVDGGALNSYVGRTSASELRDQFAHRWPELAARYRRCAEGDRSIGEIVASWEAEDFDGESESDFRALVAAAELRELLRGKLDSWSVDQARDPRRQVYLEILKAGQRHVPVTVAGRLLLVVDADDLARDVSSKAVEALL